MPKLVNYVDMIEIIIKDFKEEGVYLMNVSRFFKYINKIIIFLFYRNNFGSFNDILFIHILRNISRKSWRHQRKLFYRNCYFISDINWINYYNIFNEIFKY